MAELRLDGGELVLHLSGAEKAEAVHGDLRVPVSAIRGVEVLDDAHSWTGKLSPPPWRQPAEPGVQLSHCIDLTLLRTGAQQSYIHAVANGFWRRPGVSPGGGGC